MPPIYYLNPPPNPFWDFVAGLEDHPFSGLPGRARHPRFRGPPTPPPRPAAPTPSSAAAGPAQADMSEKSKGKQPTVEDPPEVDPATIKPETENTQDNKAEKSFPFRARGRFADAFDEKPEPEKSIENNNDNGFPFRGRGRFADAFNDNGNTENQRGRGPGRCGGRGRAGWNGQPPFAFGHPFFPRPPWAAHGPTPPGDHEHRGPLGPPHCGRRAHERHERHERHEQERQARHGPHGHHRGPSPPHQRRPGFDLGEFLNNLGGKLGIDLTNAAEGLGLTADIFTAGRIGQDVNFEPRADIFENKNAYTIHLSLPGAKKEDVGVDYDGEHSILRVTGVVHRPDVDEQMMSELMVNGRRRETGVFEKAIRLGTKRDPANVDVAGISAKMTDGVLVVKIPKVEKVHHKREVPITADPVTEGQADYEDEYSEKPVLFDAEQQASVVVSEATEALRRDDMDLLDMKDNEQPSERKLAGEAVPVSKALEAEQEQKDAYGDAEKEQLPAYTATSEHGEDDWEKFSDASGEGEYIKIDVK